MRLAIETTQEQHTQQVVESLQAAVDEIQPTDTEREVDELLDQLADAALIARLARSAAWRA
jgi:truncated hemoglobin YjbI